MIVPVSAGFYIARWTCLAGTGNHLSVQGHRLRRHKAPRPECAGKLAHIHRTPKRGPCTKIEACVTHGNKVLARIQVCRNGPRGETPRKIENCDASGPPQPIVRAAA